MQSQGRNTVYPLDKAIHSWNNRGLVRDFESFKVIPRCCIAHPYCDFFVQLGRAHSARTSTTWRFLYETKLAREIKGHFLLNEHGDLSIIFFFFSSVYVLKYLFQLPQNTT